METAFEIMGKGWNTNNQHFPFFPQCSLPFLTLSQTSPCFYMSAEQSFENTVGKGEIAR